MKALRLYAKDTGAIAPVKIEDFSQVATGQAIAAPGCVGFVLSSTGQPVPINIQLIRFRS